MDDNNKLKTELCKTCPYYGQPFVPPQKAQGSCELLIIGEAPGEQEAQKGIPFCGPSGKFMRIMVGDIFTTMERMSISNSVLCHPPGNETPQAKALELCTRQFLFKFIEDTNPRAILCLGAVAAAVFKVGKVSEDAGIAKSWGGRTLIMAYHPAYVLRNPDAEADFRRVIRQAYNILYPKALDKQLFCVRTLEELHEAAEEIGRWKGPIGSDIETTGLDPLAIDAKITRISFGQGNRAFSFFFTDADPVFIQQAAEFVKKQYRRTDATFVFHHSTFDIRYLLARGITVAQFSDAEIMTFLLNENRLVSGLKELAAEFIGDYEYSINEKDPYKFGLYSSEDSFMTINLYNRLARNMTEKLWNVMNRIIIPVVPVINEMMLTGIKVDAGQAKAVSKRLQQEKTEAYTDLITKHKEFRGINLASPQQMQKVLLAIGAPLEKKTKTGFSVDEEVLLRLSLAGYEWAKKLIHMRKIDKVLSTYIDKIPKMVHADGRVHTEFNPCGCVTGRASCLPGDIWIMTDRGMCQILDIKEGDNLLGRGGSYRKVKKIWDVGKKTKLKIDFSNGCSVCSSPEHLFYSEGKWVAAKLLKNGDRCSSAMDTNVEYNYKNNEMSFAEAFGFMVAEGCITGMKNRPYVLCIAYNAQTEKEYIHEVVAAIESKIGCTFAYGKKHNDGVARACGIKYIKKIIEYGLTGKSHQRRIPVWIMKGSISDRALFLRGLFQGDGHITKNGFNLCTSSLGLAQDVQLVCASLGIKCSIFYHGTPKLSTHHQSYNVRITLQHYYKFLKSVGVPIAGGKTHRIRKNAGVFKHSMYISIGKYLNLEKLCALLPHYQTKANRWVEAIHHARRTGGEVCLSIANELVQWAQRNEYVTLPEDFILDSQAQWFNVTVRGITEVGQEDMFDLEVEGESFVANGIVVHNSKKPNLQNIPRDNNIYKMFVADEGKTFFYFDFSQIEVRIMASMSGESTMIDAYRAGKDLHRITAAMTTGKPPDQITKSERQLAKGIMFGLLYGATAEGLKNYLFEQCDIDVDIKEAARLREIFFKTYPGLQNYYRRIENEVMTKYEVESPTGRLRRFPKVKYDIANGYVNWTTGKYELPHDIRNQAYNAPIQSGASDCVFFTMSNLFRLRNKRRMPAKFILTVHDSVILEIDNKPEVINDMRGLVEMVIKEIVPNDPLFRWLRVPLSVEYFVGKSWGDLEELK